MSGPSPQPSGPAEALFVYDPELSQYQLSENHPFKPLRLELTRSLLLEALLLDSAQERGIASLAEGVLTQVHSSAYIAAVKAASTGRNLESAFSFGLGTGDNPIFPGMHESVLRVCAATVTAVDLVASGQARRAVSLAGGLHHALHDRASGFCVYNDLALAILHALDRYDLRIAYVDLDAHHGDGVQWLFYEDPSVMTISLHESGRYLFPGSGHTYEVGKGPGRGTSVNVPLEPFTEDDSFLEVFETVVPRAIEVFRPDLIVLQAGADMHRHDPLADLALSLSGMEASYRRVMELADRHCEGRLVATGGGGYDPYRTVPRAWAHLWATLTRQRLPDPLPEAWRQRWQPLSREELPHEAFDRTELWKDIPRHDEIVSHNRAVALRAITTLEPIWREQGLIEAS